MNGRRRFGGGASCRSLSLPRGAEPRCGFFDNRQREDQSEDPWWTAFARAHGSAFFQTPRVHCISIAELRCALAYPRPLAPCELRGVAYSATKANSGRNSRAHPRENAQKNNRRLRPNNLSCAAAPLAARPCRPLGGFSNTVNSSEDNLLKKPTGLSIFSFWQTRKAGH